MPEDALGEKPPEKPINPQMLDGECFVCAKEGRKVALAIPFPAIISLHHQICSVITIPHTKGIVCKVCGTYYNAMVINCSVEMTLAPQAPFETNEDKLIQLAQKMPNLKLVTH